METLKTKTHVNVMLIAMSTLPRFPKINTYQIEENGKTLYFKSLSQMEPHTKYVIYKLASSGETLDRIVILESEKARTETPQKWGGETATSLYKKRLINYLGGNEEISISIQDELESKSETILADVKTGHSLPECYYPEFIPVHLEDPVYFWHAVNAIRGKGPLEALDDSTEKSIHLYMDMQGGERNSVSQMNAIVELLKRQGITIQGRYANDFEPKRPIPLHTIREASKEYRTYDLISAMDSFKRYGWGDSLKEYFDGFMRGSSKEQKLIEAVQQASSAISKCNANGFDGAIQKIKSLREDFKNPETITELDVVYQDIREDYGRLFDADYPHVAQIRWCLDKKFLQQALTIFEAKMPQEFVLSGLIYYLKKDATSKDRQAFLETCERVYTDLNKKERFRMKDLNHYLLKDYCNGFERGTSYFLDPEGLLCFGLGDERKDEVVSLLEEYRSLCSLRNQLNHAITGNHNEGGFFRFMKKRHPYDRNWKDSTATNYEKRIRDYIDKWVHLADQVPKELKKNILDLS